MTVFVWSGCLKEPQVLKAFIGGCLFETRSASNFRGFEIVCAPYSYENWLPIRELHIAI